MRVRTAATLAFLLLLARFGLAGLTAAQQPAPPPRASVPQQVAHLVLLNARVWTGDEARPEAEAVALRGNRIVKVGTSAEVQKLVAEGVTRVLNLRGRLVLPGFIDNHTHFESAGRLLLGLNLLDVNEPAAFVARVREVASRDRKSVV